MVQMQPPGAALTGVSFEAEGGIRNPVCQDEDSPESKTSTKPPQQQQQKKKTLVRELQDGIRLPSKKIEDPCKIHEKSQEFQEAMTLCRTRVPWTFSGNLFVTLLVFIVMIFGELGIIPNQKVGFYCNDPKISYKFTGDTIPTVILILITITLPAFTIWVTELVYYSSDSYKNLDCRSNSRGRQFWQWYGNYTLGWWYLLFIVEIMKVIVGEPRPHFIDSCRPKEIVNCTDQYRSLYTCTNTELSWFYVNDSDKSFPSGHSAVSIFTSTFLVWYLQRRIPDRVMMILVKPWLQCLVILWGFGCSLSRITDNRHHWWDVAFGTIMGIVFGVFVVHVLCKQFKPNVADSEEPQTPSPIDYPSAKKRHQSVKKLLSDGSSIEAPEGRELGDIPATWTA